MSDKSGGSAFPRAGHHDNGNGKTGGMTLRDYLAAKVICGLSANTGVNRIDLEELAKMAYSQADAMLKARK